METGLRLMTVNKNNKKQFSINRLSIQVSLNGLSFCILNDEKKSIDFLKSFFFTKKLSPNALLDKLQNDFNSEEPLNQDFNDIIVVFKNNLSTMVPKSLFDKDCLADYLKFNNKILSTDFIAFDAIESLDSMVVYVPYININNFLYDRFGSFTYKHHTTILLEELIKLGKHTLKPKMFVYVNKFDFDVVIIEEGQLILYNNFEYNTKEDFIYYILFTSEQLGLNPETFELELLGEIDIDDELYQVVYKYVRNVSLGKRQDTYEFSNQSIPKSSSSDLIILNSF